MTFKWRAHHLKVNGEEPIMRRKARWSNKRGRLATQFAHHNLDRATLGSHLEVHMSDRHFSHEVWLSKLRDHLTEERYAAGTSRQCIAVARHFLRCLDKQKVDVSTAQPANVEEYLQQARRMYRRRHGHPPDYKGWRCLHTNGIHMLLRLVQGQWPPAPKAVTPVEILQSEIARRVRPMDGRSARPRSGNGVSSLFRGRASSRLAGGASNPRGTCDPHPSRCGRLYEVSGSGR